MYAEVIPGTLCALGLGAATLGSGFLFGVVGGGFASADAGAVRLDHAARARIWGQMNVQEALDAWQAQYAGQPPVGFMLRFSHDAVWTRIHYLREGSDTRAPDHDQQTASRFDAVASALFTGTTVLLLAIDIDQGPEDTAELLSLGADAITPPDSWVEALSGYLPDASRVQYLATTMSWQRGCLDKLWFAVARDLTGRVAVFCPATGDAFLPYGGGADLFVWGAERRAKLGDRFRAWLPSPGMPGALHAHASGASSRRG